MKNLSNLGKGIRYAYSFVFNKPCIGPYLLVLRVYNQCNMQCIFCPINSPSSRIRLKEKKEIDIALFRDIVDEATELGVSKIELSGNGEPFMDKRIFEMLGYIKKRGMAVNIVTNGFLLNKRAITRILDLKLDKLIVSVDAGTKEVYDSVHRPISKGAFEHIKSNLLLLNGLRKDLGSSLNFVFHYTICNKNYQDIINGIKLAKEVGADFVAFRNLCLYPGLEHLSVPEKERKQYQDILVQANKTASELRIKTTLSHLMDAKHHAKDIPCYLGWFYMMVRSDGGILACCTGPKRYSSMKTQKLEDIWKSADYNQFRTLWRDKNARIAEGYGCKTCTFKIADSQLDKIFSPLKPLKDAIERVGKK